MSEIKELSSQELRERLDNEKSLMVRMKLNHAISPLDNPIKIRDTRKNIARLETELRTRELNSKSNS
jgi:large subunit ribosomal protein L29